MTRESIAGLVGLTALAAVGGLALNGALKGDEPAPEVKVDERDAGVAELKKVAPEVERAEKLIARSSAQLAAEGVPLVAAVYERELSDGGVALFAIDRRPDAGEKWRPVTGSPCRKRPKGVEPALCLQRNPFTVTSDPGDETVMQPGMWVGAGCVPAPCAEFFGGRR